jgi:hypothetical protein
MYTSIGLERRTFSPSALASFILSARAIGPSLVDGAAAPILSVVMLASGRSLHETEKIR